MQELVRHIFPCVQLNLHSDLSKEELIQRLESETETSLFKNSLPLFPKSYKVFRGKLKGDSFHVVSSPIAIFSHLTCYQGKFVSKPRGTLIELKMSLHPFIKSLLMIWICVAFVLCLTLTAMILQALFQQAGYLHYHPVILFPFLLLSASMIISLLPIKLAHDEGLTDLCSLLKVT